MRTVHAAGTGERLGEIQPLSVKRIPELVGAARRAQRDWAAAAPHHRADALAAAAQRIEEEADELARMHARESGKVITQARHEVRSAAQLLRWNADTGRFASGEVAPTGAVPGAERDLTIVERVPLGVVVAVLPFNFPIELAIEKAGAALAAGNAVILKLPRQNPLATLAVARILQLHLPTGLLGAVDADDATSEQLCSSRGEDAVSLTGSVRAGQSVARATAGELRRLHLELGGNGAVIVRPDADLELAISEVVRGRLLMNGQACAATKRVIAHRSVASEVTDRLVAELSAVEPTDPLSAKARLGPLIDATAATRVEQQVDAAVSAGARRILGSPPEGAWYGPTVLADVPPHAALLHDDEVFGPVVPITAVESDDEAIELANATRLRLTAAVFSTDLGAAMAVAERLEVGGVVVNGTNNYRPPVVPFGGTDLAGAGREGRGWTMAELTRTRFIALRGLRSAVIAPDTGWSED